MSLADGDGTAGREPLAAGGGTGGRGPVILGLVLVLVAAGAAGFFLLRRSDEPAPVPAPGSSPASSPSPGSSPAEAATPVPLGLVCGPVEKRPDFGAAHTTEPPIYEESPPASGPHAPITLPAEPSVYPIPFPPELEWLAVHNLEHGYVLIRYRDGWVPQETIDVLTQLANAEPEVILAVSSSLPEGVDVAFVAWRRVRPCSAGPGENPVDVARAFIERFRNGRLAPESNPT